jgi:hypothetical protein
MAKNTTEQPTQEIPYGYCHCGCGRKTRPARQTDTRYGWVKGQPVKYLPGHNPVGVPWQVRFWKYVDIRAASECWPWTGYTNKGYGYLSVNAHPVAAYRLSYILHFGPITDGLYICHRCNNPICVNPAHLYAGTQKDNHHDSVVAGTARKPPNRWASASKSL